MSSDKLISLTITFNIPINYDKFTQVSTRAEHKCPLNITKYDVFLTKQSNALSHSQLLSKETTQ